ncbi:MAG: UTP-glucose-1-phosphate uridylyltransferase [Candidatus Azambacteria bacterium GW2011_GWE1_42_9]|nr:MAG: UTP-glucose-1-phosphate uridylyltransferase [Candidatus Azambacteria bacterium GW2011_GWA2_42_62]KKS73568.1 MAG: UTP-glucose-1-phosphate uridylyltransferase [Candidatus Azambacteria bacterium GW2011_GWB1_42_72]KKS79666.1 MAG: UTP-glucose-1-phosphate uridylyltransferase [Candidatus Azambacteria bacterium GW2011_GWE1_42_9]KKT16461.1 MAG: hypothetical protein UV99_C0013G0028 [Parcubacteria group bacterium GW2011_GWC1_43_61]OGD41140.1 MAG: hypothetical protein A3K28_01120 [Candidatus Azamba
MRLSIKKLVIPLAGFGMRFLPVSKNYPKEMINLVDRPIVQYLVQEACESGIREVIFVVNGGKDIIKQYFSSYQYSRQKKACRVSPIACENLKELESLLRVIRFRIIKKNMTLGDGHSILCAESYLVREKAFAVTMGDLLGLGPKPFLSQLAEQYALTGAPMVSVERVPKEAVSRFGIIAPAESRAGLHRVLDVVEKPRPEIAPSNLALTGKYILTPAIFPYLKRAYREKTDNEVRLATALKFYAADYPLFAYECEGKIQDTGNKLDLLKATVNFGLTHKNFGAEFKKFLKSLPLEN